MLNRVAAARAGDAAVSCVVNMGTETALVTGSGMGAISTTMITLLTAHSRAEESQVYPAAADSDWKRRAAGNGSVHCTSAAASGPRFCKVMA